MTSRLTIAVPAYNQGPYIEETLESLLAQDVAPLEIVVSDNHSTDETPEVLARYADRIRVVRPPEHIPHMAPHWNFLVRQTRGDWVAVLSSDDIALPNYVEVLERGANAVPDAVLSHAAFHRADGDGQITKTKIVKVPQVSRAPRTLGDQLRGSAVSFAAFAVRRDAFDRIGGFPETMLLACDWGMNVRIVPEGAFVYQRTPISRYRMGHQPQGTRLPIFAGDYARMYLEIIPEVAAAVGYDDTARTEAASREMCHGWMYRCSLETAADDRAVVVAVFEAWARSCGLEDTLARFAAGEDLPRKDYPPVRLFFSDLSYGWRKMLGRV